MTYQEKINVMASWLAEPGELRETDTVSYDEPTGNCDGSQWTRREWSCTPAMWAEAKKVAANF